MAAVARPKAKQPPAEGLQKMKAVEEKIFNALHVCFALHSAHCALYRLLILWGIGWLKNNGAKFFNNIRKIKCNVWNKIFLKLLFFFFVFIQRYW